MYHQRSVDARSVSHFLQGKKFPEERIRQMEELAVLKKTVCYGRPVYHDS